MEFTMSNIIDLGTDALIDAEAVGQLLGGVKGYSVLCKTSAFRKGCPPHQKIGQRIYWLRSDVLRYLATPSEALRGEVAA